MPVRFKLDVDKTVAAIVFLAASGTRDLTKYKIVKLLFLADKYHLVRYGRTITGDRICAMDHGPVPSVALDALNAFLGTDKANPQAREIAKELSQYITVDDKYRNKHFNAWRTCDYQRSLSPSDLGALDAVVKEHGAKSFDELKAMTHEMFAYRKAWGERACDNPVMNFEDLFVEDPDAIEGAYEEMIENYELYRGKPAF
jgi:uncharacterized phage-associated protein